MDARVGGITHAPGERFEEVVMLDEDVRWDDAWDVDVGATEHDILTGRLEVVVRERHGAWRVPGADRLRVLAHQMDLGDVGVLDGEVDGVGIDTTLGSRNRIAVYVASVDYDVVRQGGHGCFQTRAKLEHLVGPQI